MSKPKRKLLGTSENLLGGVVSFSNFSHWSGMNGMLMIKISWSGAALLGVVSGRTAEGAYVFTFAAWNLSTTGRTIPCKTVSLA
jgi:hypothetical protein